MSKEKLSLNYLLFGADPEFFFTKRNRVIGCEKLIPTNGIKLENSGSLIIDGVQAELNISPQSCRQIFASNFKEILDLSSDLIKDKKELKISSKSLLPISKAELGNLSDKAKYFGCTPSKNIYDEKNIMPIKDSSKYYFRSAGGHIHIGGDIRVKLMHDNQKEFIKMMDIIVGNTCVLLDRDEGNIERRKIYGRAGEYRVPKHGLEYRTLSNFWIRDYVLMSFVLGITRLAFSLTVNKLEGKNDFADKICKAVNQNDIRTAINNNDFDLAMSNFLKILPIIEEISPVDDNYTLHKGNSKQFLKLVKRGINKYFSEDIVRNWENFDTVLPMVNDGFENFINKI